MTSPRRHNGLHGIIGAMGLALVVLALLFVSVLHQIGGLKSVEQQQRHLISALKQELTICQHNGCVEEPKTPAATSVPGSAGAAAESSRTVVVVKPAAKPAPEPKHNMKPQHPKPKPSPSPTPSPTCGPLSLLCGLSAVSFP